ncbi:MAG TPA: ATP phosphoribosyltransferase, partial [Desulfurobacteriaceae bacterium]|nr:ATP phosphoribosyltransferase [Desulfurobacteriaceae bacterium]
MITIAIPKGRLFKNIKSLLVKVDPNIEKFDENSRK